MASGGALAGVLGALLGLLLALILKMKARRKRSLPFNFEAISSKKVILNLIMTGQIFLSFVELFFYISIAVKEKSP